MENTPVTAKCGCVLIIGEVGVPLHIREDGTTVGTDALVRVSWCNEHAPADEKLHKYSVQPKEPA